MPASLDSETHQSIWGGLARWANEQNGGELGSLSTPGEDDVAHAQFVIEDDEVGGQTGRQGSDPIRNAEHPGGRGRRRGGGVLDRHPVHAYGAAHPALYPLVLRFLTSDSELLARHTDDLARVLAHIERERIMPPLAVVQVLSRNGVASVGLVKKWLMGQIKSAREEIDTVRLLSSLSEISPVGWC